MFKFNDGDFHLEIDKNEADEILGNSDDEIAKEIDVIKNGIVGGQGN